MLSLFRRTPKAPYRRLEHFQPELARILVINWSLGNTCNHKCSYCPPSLHNGSRDWVDLETITRVTDQIQKHYGPDREYFFEFTGGEVTLIPHFLKICEEISARGCKIGIISNASRALPFWEKARPHLTQACLSYHPEFAKAEHFLQVARFLSQTVRVHLNFMMKPQNFHEVFALACMAKEIENVSVALQPLIVDFDRHLYDYTDFQKKILDNQQELIVRYIPKTRVVKHIRGQMAVVHHDGRREGSIPHIFIANGENNWQGWKCYAGIEQFIVTMDGKLYRGWCEVGGAFGHISDKQIRFPTAPVTCSRTACHCNFDIMSTKVSP